MIQVFVRFWYDETKGCHTEPQRALSSSKGSAVRKGLAHHASRASA